MDPIQAEQARKGRVPEQLGKANSQHLFQFLPSLLHLRNDSGLTPGAHHHRGVARVESHLGKDVPPHSFLGPGLVVEGSSSLLLRIPSHISDDLQKVRKNWGLQP